MTFSTRTTQKCKKLNAQLQILYNNNLGNSIKVRTTSQMLQRISLMHVQRDTGQLAFSDISLTFDSFPFVSDYCSTDYSTEPAYMQTDTRVDSAC